MNLGLILNNLFDKPYFEGFSVFYTKYSVILGDKKIPNSKMVHRRKILTTEVKSNKRFFYIQSGFGF